MKNILSKYLEKRSLIKPESIQKRKNGIAVVIPICDEYPIFIQTLYSLYSSFIHTLDIEAYVVCVINNTIQSTQIVKKNNQTLIAQIELMKIEKFPLLDIDILDLASNGKEMPIGQGVGYARKYGMDYAIACGCNIIACMDADTLVQENYFSELDRFQKDNSGHKYALCRFKHQKAESELNQKAIDIYEDYMFTHSRVLKECGTPYYPIALGPTIVCTANSYVACGGMNLRLAGEDFYFLQSLIKLEVSTGINNPLILKTTVNPSSRFSSRVLFGTGTKLKDIVEEFTNNKVSICKEYNEIVYRIIKEFIKTKKTSDATLMLFLEKENFYSVWDKILEQTKKNPQKTDIAFHTWFDGLKILRAIHTLSKQYK